MKKILFILLCILAGAQTMKAQEAYVVMNNDTWKFYYDTKKEHREFTNKWRSLIGYGEGNITPERVLNVAKDIYKDYPEILKALKIK